MAKLVKKLFNDLKTVLKRYKGGDLVKKLAY